MSSFPLTTVYHIFQVETTNQIVSSEALPLNPGKDLWLILGSPRGRLRNALSRALREFEAEKPLSAMDIYGILEGLMGLHGQLVLRYALKNPTAMVF